MLLILVVLVLVVAAFVLYVKDGDNNRPPGPRGLPFIQQTFSVELVRKERTYMKLAKQYGPIFQVSVFGIPTVVISDPDLIREAFSLPTTTLRPYFKVLEVFLIDVGIVFSNGEVWQYTRRSTLHHLRNLGMGRSKLEGVIHDQISGFLDEVLAPSEGRPLSFDQSLRVAVANIIWGTVSSEQFAIGDTRALAVMDSFDEVGKHLALFGMMIVCPALMKLPYRLTGMQKLLDIFELPINTLIQPAIHAHAQTVDLDSEPRDYIDCLLQEQHRNPTLFTNRHMQRCILDLFVAGYDTTTSTLRWAFCFLCTWPEVQRRLRAEILAVVGEERPPTLADRPRMPYTEAVLMETQRLGDIAPVGIEHVTSETIQLGGYTIQRGTQLHALLTAVHMNPTLFPEPDQFRPERFLNADGKVQPNKALMPFSVGRRACLGEAMARAELFLFVTSVLQRYTLRFPDGFHHDLSCLEHKQIIREPTLFDLVFERA